MSYAQVLSTASLSAWSTLEIIDRQSRKDFAKSVHFAVWLAQVLTSKQAIQHYRAVWNLFCIACLVAIALGSSARELTDWLVARCEAQPAPPPIEKEELKVTDSAAAALPPAQPAIEPAPQQRPVKRSVALRQRCQQAGIKWKNAHGRHQHLTIAEMEAALAVLS